MMPNFSRDIVKKRFYYYYLKSLYFTFKNTACQGIMDSWTELATTGQVPA